MKIRVQKALLKIFLGIPLVLLGSNDALGNSSSDTQIIQAIQSEPEATKAEKVRRIAIDALQAGELAVLAQYILEHVSVISHEYGHAIPSIVDGLPYKIEIQSTRSIIFP